MTTLKLGECLYMSGCGKGEETPRVLPAALAFWGLVYQQTYGTVIGSL